MLLLLSVVYFSSEKVCNHYSLCENKLLNIDSVQTSVLCSICRQLCGCIKEGYSVLISFMWVNACTHELKSLGLSNTVNAYNYHSTNSQLHYLLKFFSVIVATSICMHTMDTFFLIFAVFRGFKTHLKQALIFFWDHKWHLHLKELHNEILKNCKLFFFLFLLSFSLSPCGLHKNHAGLRFKTHTESLERFLTVRFITPVPFFVVMHR